MIQDPNEHTKVDLLKRGKSTSIWSEHHPLHRINYMAYKFLSTDYEYRNRFER